MTLLDFINSISVEDQKQFALKCGTTIGYMRKAISKGQLFNAKVCIEIEKNSNGAVTCEEMRSDIDWSFLRKESANKPCTAIIPIERRTHERRQQDRRVGYRRKKYRRVFDRRQS
ncbi:transcriptional regulator [Nitrosomonas communis]|uniref:transcriptional regulator n=1 Tax=Nitrosomonas communis TaxID=44574 RepID=UPI003D288C5B